MAETSKNLGAYYNDEISRSKIWQVIGASAVGTMIEWYDFYIFGSLAPFIAPLFYPPGNDTFAYIAYLATFAVGFVVRPFGALFFGRIGDLVGRKYAFLVTLLIMGGSTAIIGFLPAFAAIGWAAPIILLLVRVLQGLALGGEYGGAGSPTGILHIIHSDNRNARAVHVARGHTRGSEFDVAGTIRRKGRGNKRLANTVSRFDTACCYLAIYSAEDGRVADLSTGEIDRHDIGQSPDRSIHSLG